MRLIDEQYTKTPFYGSPRMTAYLHRQPQARAAADVKKGVKYMNKIARAKLSLLGIGRRNVVAM
jgi:hypothetical protein